jgi:NAD(P)-dependent dehydrogenase (short-subunit alcohol dehydrogenase family)
VEVPGPQERFAGGTAVITGAGAGIGEGFARYLSGIGMNVIIGDIDRARGQALADELSTAGRRAEFIPLDVTDPDEMEALAGHVFSRYGSVELLINNAGLETGGLLWEVSVERWRRLMAVNVDGVYFGIRSFVPRMLEVGAPAVVANLSSVGGVGTAPLQAPYIVSKHAVLALTECLHQELAFLGSAIQVSAILPHQVKSQIFLDAQREAPSGNAAADQVFATMQAANAGGALGALEAAEHMMQSIAAGHFWIFSDDVLGPEATGRRAEHLGLLTPPADPVPILERMGVDIDAARRQLT